MGLRGGPSPTRPTGSWTSTAGALSLSTSPKPGWRNGIRGRLKICYPKGFAGSIPAPGTWNHWGFWRFRGHVLRLLFVRVCRFCVALYRLRTVQLTYIVSLLKWSSPHGTGGVAGISTGFIGRVPPQPLIATCLSVGHAAVHLRTRLRYHTRAAPHEGHSYYARKRTFLSRGFHPPIAGPKYNSCCKLCECRLPTVMVTRTGAHLMAAPSPSAPR